MQECVGYYLHCGILSYKIPAKVQIILIVTAATLSSDNKIFKMCSPNDDGKATVRKFHKAPPLPCSFLVAAKLEIAICERREGRSMV